MNDEQANRALRPAVILWTLAGLVGIPLAVYFDLLGGWRWPPYVQRAPVFLIRTRT
jgi:predicted MFS family arabinose efflux permease